MSKTIELLEKIKDILYGTSPLPMKALTLADLESDFDPAITALTKLEALAELAKEPKLDSYYSKAEVKKIIEGVLQRALLPKQGCSPAGDIAEQVYCYLVIQKIEAEHKKQPEPTEFVKKTRHNLKIHASHGDTHRLGNRYAEIINKACGIIDTQQAKIEQLKKDVTYWKDKYTELKNDIDPSL